MPANMPPKPTTDATARFGKMSAITEYMVADQPWCAAPASAKKLAASQGLLTCGVRITGNVNNAQIKVAVFRARFNGHPHFKNNALEPPPPTLPSAAAPATKASGQPKPPKFKLNWS